MIKTGMIIIGVAALISCNQTKTSNTKTEDITITEEVKTMGSDTTINFDSYETNKLPSDWSQYYTGKAGEKPNWQIVDDNGNKVLAQLTSDNPNYHFNDVVFNNIVAKNVELTVKMKAVKGGMDQGGGFIWRFTDANNYYVVRANPLEDNVVLYKVENGKRTDLPLIGKGRTYGVDVPKLGMDWNTLKLIAKDDIFTVFLNGKEIFKVKDSTFKNAGKVGLWTKADAVTYFDEFDVVVEKIIKL